MLMLIAGNQWSHFLATGIHYSADSVTMVTTPATEKGLPQPAASSAEDLSASTLPQPMQVWRSELHMCYTGTSSNKCKNF